MAKSKKYEKALQNNKYSQATMRRIVGWLALVCVIFIFSIFSIGTAIGNNIEAKEVLKDKEAELIQMQEKKKMLEYDLQKLDDPEYIAQYIRDDYYFTAEGEIFFLLPEEEENNDESTTNNN